MKSAGFPADEPLLEGQEPVGRRIKTVLPHAHAVISAPELRARQTTETVAANFTIEPVFRDIDCGRWAGRSLAEIQEREPEGLMEWLSSADSAPHGGESVADAIGRVAGWLAAQLSTGGHTVIVTHPAIIRAAVVSVLDAPKESFRKIDVRPWSISELTSDGRRWALRSFGCMADERDA